MMFQNYFRMIRGLAHLNVVQVACGWKHSLVLTDNGRLFSFGDNTYGQLGLGNHGGNRVLTPQVKDQSKKIVEIDSL